MISIITLIDFFELIFLEYTFTHHLDPLLADILQRADREKGQIRSRVKNVSVCVHTCTSP